MPGDFMDRKKKLRPLCLARLGIAARDEDRPVGPVRARGPDLLAVDHPVVAVALGARAQAGQVGAGAGLGEELAPHLIAAEGRRRIPLLLLVGARRRRGSACTCRGRSRSSRAGRGSAIPPARRSPGRSGAGRGRPTPRASGAPAKPASALLRWKACARSSPSQPSRPGSGSARSRRRRAWAPRGRRATARASARNAASSRVSSKSTVRSYAAPASSRVTSRSFQRRALPSMRPVSLARR